MGRKVKMVILSYELVGGPFCGVVVVPAKPPEQVLLLKVDLMRGLLDSALEARYAKRLVRYEVKSANGTRAVYRCTGIYGEVGRVQT